MANTAASPARPDLQPALDHRWADPQSIRLRNAQLGPAGAECASCTRKSNSSSKSNKFGDKMGEIFDNGGDSQVISRATTASTISSRQ
jgi:hypothetical protein